MLVDLSVTIAPTILYKIFHKFLIFSFFCLTSTEHHKAFLPQTLWCFSSFSFTFSSHKILKLHFFLLRATAKLFALVPQFYLFSSWQLFRWLIFFSISLMYFYPVFIVNSIVLCFTDFCMKILLKNVFHGSKA